MTKDMIGYREKWAKEKGFSSFRDYQKRWANGKGHKSYSGYLESWAREKGYTSYNDYVNEMASKRKEMPENKNLSSLIKIRLKELGENQTWLAQHLGCTRQAVSLYALGKNCPKMPMLKKIYFVLDVPLGKL